MAGAGHVSATVSLLGPGVLPHGATVPERGRLPRWGLPFLLQVRMAESITSLEQAKRWREEMREQNRIVVFTNGCFDILHAGHVALLETARSFGDALVVGMNSDESVQRLKGVNRPVVGQQDRATVLAALRSVDKVVVFEQDTPFELIETLLPDVLVKGGDWTPDNVVGRDVVEANGGRVEIVPLVENRSTTNVIDEVIKRYCG